MSNKSTGEVDDYDGGEYNECGKKVESIAVLVDANGVE